MLRTHLPFGPFFPGLVRSMCAASLLLAASITHAASLQVQVLDKEGKPVSDAVVVIYPEAPTTALIAQAAPQLPMQATINQEKMRFLPALTVLPVGAKVRFTNMDTWEHHVRGGATLPAAGTQSAPDEFELHLPGRVGNERPSFSDVVFERAGVTLLGCHIHGSMRGHVFVTDSPWTLKTDVTGAASFGNLPEGSVRVRVWHAEQLLDLPVQTLKLGAAPTQTTVQLLVVPRRRRI